MPVSGPALACASTQTVLCITRSVVGNPLGGEGSCKGNGSGEFACWVE